jgi:phage terminase large subunit-like protein
VLQNKILGQFVDGKFEGGLTKSERILYNTIVRGQLKDSIKEIKIQHKDSGISTLSFFSYEQGQHILMGSVVDFVLVDEEPRDSAIYPQLLTRTLNGNKGKGGLILLSFTPENGLTELVYQFTQELKETQYLQVVTWDEAPHLSEQKKHDMLEAYPVHQREMRSKGVPQLGSGAVYPYPDDWLYDNITEIPAHWRRINGIDFGFKNCGLAWGAYDADADCLHIYSVIKTQDQTPAEIAVTMDNHGKWIPWAYPHDGHLPDRGTGEQQKMLYSNNGANMLHEHATFEDGGNSVEAGIMRLTQRIKTGRLKVAKNLTEFFKEKRLYHRKDGKIVKSNDHILDAVRYLEMQIRYAVTEIDMSSTVTFNKPIASRFVR